VKESFALRPSLFDPGVTAICSDGLVGSFASAALAAARLASATSTLCSVAETALLYAAILPTRDVGWACESAVFDRLLGDPVLAMTSPTKSSYDVAAKAARAATDPNGPTGRLATWLANTALDDVPVSVLASALPGYADYMRRVGSRIVPGVW
jgi:hypothetical protein